MTSRFSSHSPNSLTLSHSLSLSPPPLPPLSLFLSFPLPSFPTYLLSHSRIHTLHSGINITVPSQSRRGSSWSKALQYPLCWLIRCTRVASNCRLWICQAAESREWSVNDSLLHGKFRCSRGAQETGLWCSHWYMELGSAALHYAGWVRTTVHT